MKPRLVYAPQLDLGPVLMATCSLNMKVTSGSVIENTCGKSIVATHDATG